MNDDFEIVPEWTLGDRLRKARETADLEQIELARDIGVSRNTVANYERGKTTARRPVVLAWAVRCGVPIEWLWTGRVPESGVPLADRITRAGRRKYV